MTPKAPRIVAMVTGSRAEFGLLRPVIDAVNAHPRLRGGGGGARVVVAGSHFLPPARTEREVAAAYPIAARVPMQALRGPRTRAADAVAVARGVEGFARAFARLRPDWVVVLGDRIEALAAAVAASVGGLAVAHIHGGDRAEGVADEAMRHAISKLAHLHAAATPASARRLVRMGERPEHVHVTGSPAIDGLLAKGAGAMPALSDRQVALLGVGAVGSRARSWRTPRYVFLLHPSGLPDADEQRLAHDSVWATDLLPEGERTLALAPNHDPGRAHVVAALSAAQRAHGWRLLEHLPRARFVGLLKWMAERRVPLVGNSSAGLIECAALGVPVINLGPRQAGRERLGNVFDVPDPARGLHRAEAWLSDTRVKPSAVLGRGRAGRAIAELLARIDPRDASLLRKRNTY